MWSKWRGSIQRARRSFAVTVVVGWSLFAVPPCVAAQEGRQQPPPSQSESVGSAEQTDTVHPLVLAASETGAPTEDGPSGSDQLASSPSLDLRGAFYADWFRVDYGDGVSSGQLSTRLRMEIGPEDAQGWQIHLDLRDRLGTTGEGSHQIIVYDAYVSLDSEASPFSVYLGQMNLYDSAGIGTLLGGVVGYEVDPAITVGGYAGLQPDIYAFEVDSGYQKYGVFARYDGTQARSVALSYNTIRFGGHTERRFVYGSGLFPVGPMMLYGDLEYEMGTNVAKEDRLSRVFLNARFNLTDAVDVTGTYSFGKGLDYHRFLLDQSRDPRSAGADLERFYYSKQYGARLSVKPVSQVRLFLDERRGEQADQMIVNNTTQLGASAWDLAGLGISFYGAYSMNRGDASESDAFRLSLGRDFGSVSWTVYYSSSFNGVRFDAASGRPEVVHMDDRRTLTNDFFFVITRAVALSLEHELTFQGGSREMALFARAIYRF